MGEKDRAVCIRMGKQIGSGPDLFVHSLVVLLHQSVQSIPERGVQEWSGEGDGLLFSDLANQQCS